MTRLGRYLYYALVPSQRSKGSFALSYFCFVCVCGAGGGWTLCSRPCVHCLVSSGGGLVLTARRAGGLSIRGSSYPSPS